MSQTDVFNFLKAHEGIAFSSSDIHKNLPTIPLNTIRINIKRVAKQKNIVIHKFGKRRLYMYVEGGEQYEY